jgi:alkylation response protein AidB-like acyl-CoA dehydrogenase
VSVDTDALEDVDTFRVRARAWLTANMPRRAATRSLERTARFIDEEARFRRHRELQRRLFDGGFAGLCFPRVYGGQGLAPAYQKAFDREVEDYEMPSAFNVPTLGILAATLLDCGTEEQKRRHLPAIIRGDEYWIQFLSEPSGGSDIAGALTSAVRDGDEWIINGSKVWSTRAHLCDYALCLVRTNWDVPKHRGLSVFIVKIHQPGIEIQQTEMLNGSKEFCQEFFTDLRVPHQNLVGEVDEGWTVVTRWLYHERHAVGGGSPYVSGRGGDGAHGPDLSILRLAAHMELLGSDHVREAVGEAYVAGVVHDQMIDRVNQGIRLGRHPDSAATLLRLYKGTMVKRVSTIGFELAAHRAVAWSPGDEAVGDFGTGFLMRQAAEIGGGTVEMARNVIAERYLGMPREPASDRERPFREARTNASAAR